MNQLLDAIDFDPERGRLTLQSVPYVLLRPSLLAELQKAIETYLPHQAAEIIGRAAQGEGLALAGRLKEVFSYPDEDVLRSLVFVLGEMGWGAGTVEMLNRETRELVLKVLESPFADEYGPTANPVCHYLLGLFQGAATAVFDAEASGQEVQCAARGDGLCRFVVSAS